MTSHEEFIERTFSLARAAQENGDHPFGAVLVIDGERATIYASTEPCAMCCGAIYWSGVSRLVYGCPTEVLGEIAGGSFVVPSRELFSKGRRKIEVIGPVLPEEGAEIHMGFW